MTDERGSASTGKTKEYFQQALKAAKNRSLFPCLVAALLLVVLLVVSLVSLSADIIQIVESDYVVFVIGACLFLVVAVFLAIFFTLFWESSTKSLIEENEQLKRELALTKENLATLQAHNENLVTLHTIAGREQAKDLIYAFENYLEKLLFEVKRAKHFKSSVNLPREHLKTTYVQINDRGGLSVSLPIGKQHGVVRELVFSLHREAETPHSMPQHLGRAIIDGIEEAQSFAFVEPAPIQQAYWQRVFAECKDRGHGYELELEAKPGFDAFKDYSADVLDGIQRILEDILNSTRAF